MRVVAFIVRLLVVALMASTAFEHALAADEESTGQCSVCVRLEMSSCDDWEYYDDLCWAECGSLAQACTSNGCTLDRYRIDCGG